MDRRHIALAATTIAALATSGVDPESLFWGADELRVGPTTLAAGGATRTWSITLETTLPPEAETLSFDSDYRVAVGLSDADVSDGAATAVLRQCDDDGGAESEFDAETYAYWNADDVFAECAPEAVCTIQFCLDLTNNDAELPVEVGWRVNTGLSSQEEAPKGTDPIEVPVTIRFKELAP